MLIFLFHEVFFPIVGLVLLIMFIIRVGYITLSVLRQRTEK